MGNKKENEELLNQLVGVLGEIKEILRGGEEKRSPEPDKEVAVVNRNELEGVKTELVEIKGLLSNHMGRLADIDKKMDEMPGKMKSVTSEKDL